MKKLFSAVIALTMLISAMNVNVFASNIEFSDTAGHWAENAINKWADKGIISGYPDETFKPDNPVTRAELAKILTLAFDLQPSEFVYTEKDLCELAAYDSYFDGEHSFDVQGKEIVVKGDMLAAALEKLPADKRDIILLSYFMEMTDREIARELDTVHQNVSKRRARILKLMRDYLEKEGFEWPQM